MGWNISLKRFGDGDWSFAFGGSWIFKNIGWWDRGASKYLIHHQHDTLASLILYKAA